jgi:hypothetical protein
MFGTKVFGIGLPKTGTSSLHDAVQILGLRSVHWPHDDETVRQVRHGDYKLRIMSECDVISDTPIPAIFPQLDTAFPGSKFIFTERDRDAWLTSERNAPFNHGLPAPGSHRDFYRALLYGVTAFDEERFGWVYDEHVLRVERHFAERPHDLLRIDITKNAGWEPLCAFLGLPVPDAPFPHSNRATTGDDGSALRKVARRVGRHSRLRSRVAD